MKTTKLGNKAAYDFDDSDGRSRHDAWQMLGAPSRTKPGIPSRGSAGHSVFTHEPLLVRDYRGCERHRSGRTVDTLEAGMLEAALPSR